MDRREFMQVGVGAALAARAMMQAPSVSAAELLKVDAYSRHLQWLRTADDVAEAVKEMGYDGLDITVRPFPGHVDPARVAQDLPPFVNTIRKHGILVRAITCPITDADSPNAEQILQTASSLGITHYWWGTFRYEPGKPIIEQLDALKPRVEKLAALNQKYKMKAMYHTYEGDVMVGAAIWDFLYVLRNFDPAYVSFHYDTGHMAVAGGGNTWALNLRAAGPYIGGLSVKDYVIESGVNFPGGGPYAGQPLGGFGFGGPPPGGRPPGAPPQGGAAPGGDRENPVPQTAPNSAAPVGQAGAGAGSGGGPGNGGPGARGAGGSGGGGFGGPGGGRGGAPVGRGGGGTTNPWRVRPVPLGEGLTNLPELAVILKEINFSGPVEIQAEYPNGGADNAQEKITLPREMVLGAMKHDRLVLERGLRTSGIALADSLVSCAKNSRSFGLVHSRNAEISSRCS